MVVMFPDPSVAALPVNVTACLSLGAWGERVSMAFMLHLVLQGVLQWREQQKLRPEGGTSWMCGKQREREQQSAWLWHQERKAGIGRRQGSQCQLGFLREAGREGGVTKVLELGCRRGVGSRM